jgi:signal transduction histidine kinase
MSKDFNAIEILAALGTAVFEFQVDGTFALCGTAPEWLQRFLPGSGDSLGQEPLEELFPFLGSFLPEAKEFWQTTETGSLHSDVWVQINSKGEERGLRASAIRVGNRRYLLLGVLGIDFEEMAAALQKARDRGLAYERLDRRTKKLADDHEELTLRSREVERINRLKSEFLASMSHELRTPLNAMLGFSTLLGQEKTGSLNDRQKDFLGQIARAANHLLDLINDVLDLSKIEAGYLELQVERFSFNDAVRGVLSTIRSLAQAKNITIEAVDAGDLQVYADRTRVKQILYNLLSNAIKFTPQGGKVEVRPFENQAALTVVVSDTGIGIPPEEHEAIFEKFHQVSFSGVHDGTGLGLAITRRLVEQHGGRIWVESAVGAGSCFIFTLPRKEV